MRYIVSLIFIIGANFVFAQGENPEASERRGQRAPSPEYIAMIDSLQLDADQKIQFEALEEMYRTERRKKMMEARGSGKDRQEMRAEMDKMRESQLAVLKNLFTDNQYKIYSEFLEKQQASRGGRGQGNRGGRGGRGG